MNHRSVKSFSDEEIVRLICEGAGKLFGILVERYQDRIYSLGMKFFRDPEDAADFAQDVFIKAFKGLTGFKGRLESGNTRFFSWLVSIAYNHGINSVKRGKAYESLGEEFAGSLAGDPAYNHEKEAVKEALAEAVRDLPDKYQICIDLYFFFGMSHAEISDITGFPVNTIKSHVYRAKGLLRKALKGTVAGDYYDL
ncbi:MAG: sigma-70 family RNA polymerase sigma factor [Spirochaetales bacterium]|nr:MAG: sigma-70 family RNA polymerase sigma factor [Spirochaetales bacterium]